MDLNNYQSQIRGLLLVRNDPDFINIFNKVLTDESASDKFLIKMELNRLSKPCLRIIDLRGKVPQECEAFTYENTLHYLDDNAKEAFENSLKIYKQYTIGAFEYVINDHLKIKKELQSNKTTQADDALQNQQCELIYLSEKNKRAAPRMFFVSDIEIEFEDRSKQLAQTTNISISGLRIKLKDNIDISDREIIKVSFTGFKKEFTDSRCLSAAKYQLVGQDTVDNIQYIYLNYIDNSHDLIAFIQEFIRANQYKYKIDVYYYYQLAKNKLLTNYYLANAGKLVIALNCKSPTPFLFSLENNQNKEMINYWQFENENNLYSLFNESRSLQLLDSPYNHIKTTLYSFTYVNNGICHYLSATDEELLEKDIKELFIHYGCSKESWRVYNLSLEKYHHEDNTIHPANNTQQNNELLGSITHVATLEDITQRPRLSENISGKDLNELNQFVHHNNIDGHKNTLQLFPIERRDEPRYLYKSNIIVNFDGNNYPAKILNFSLSGLKIKLKTPIEMANEAQLTLNLVDLQKVSQKFSLSEMNYTLVHYGPANTLNLQVADKKTRQRAKSFFSLLIQHNRTRFEKIPTRQEQLSFSDELKIIEGAGHLSCALFVKKEKHLFNIKYAAIDETNKALKSLFTRLSDNDNEINVTPITNNLLYKRLISLPLNSKKENAVLTESLIYVKATQTRANKWKIKSYLNEDFTSLKERDDFIEYSKEKSQIYVLHYRLTALERPDFSIIQHEMNAISRFALHLTKKLKEELLAMNGLIEITDCTPVFEKLSLQK
jgi:hypothetical protein